MTVLPSEIERRIVRFQQALSRAELDAALVVEASGLVYLTGVMADAHLLVPAHGDPVLLVRRSLERVHADSPIEDVRSFHSFKDLPPLIAELGIERLARILQQAPEVTSRT